MNIIIFSILVIILLLGSVYQHCIQKIELFQDTSNGDVPTFKDNIVNIYDDKGNKIKVALIVAPMNDDDKKVYDTYKDTIIFMGMTSYLEFPNIISNPLDVYNDPNHKSWTFDYKNKLAGWFYCFKNPGDYFPMSIPKLLLSESDFADSSTIQPDKKIKIKYDFIYICHKYDADDEKCPDDWVAYNKNWKFAVKCLDIMCSRFKLKGLLVGRMGCELPSICIKHMDMTEKLPWNDLLQKYKETKFIFVPNIYDASPRIITEALCSDIPILVNKNILGGWKYVTPETGETFNTIADFPTQLQKLLGNMANYKPRQHFIDNYGIVRSGKKMLDFIKHNYNHRLQLSSTIKYVSPRFKKIDYEIATS